MICAVRGQPLVRHTIILLAAILLAACGQKDGLKEREEEIQRVLARHADLGLGLGSDAVWLVKHSRIAGPIKTAVFFG